MKTTNPGRNLPNLRLVLMYRPLTILVTIAFALGLAGLYVLNAPSTFTSHAVILISPAPGNPLSAETASGNAMQTTVALETEAQLVGTESVMEVVEQHIDGNSLRDSDALSAIVPSNTQTLEISFTSTSPEEAQRGAQAFAEGYLEHRQNEAQAVLESTSDRLTEQIEDAEEKFQSVTAEASDDEATRYPSHETELLADRLARLNNSLIEAQGLSTYPGSVIVRAEYPEKANELPGWGIVAASVVFGLALGLGLGLVREWRGDLIRDETSVEPLGIPVLANVAMDSTLLTDTNANPTAYEAFRQLRTQIIAEGPCPRVVAVSEFVNEGAAGGSGRSADVAVNLALVLAEARFSVLLIATPSQEAEVRWLLKPSASMGTAEPSDYPPPNGQALEKLRGISLLTVGLDHLHSSDLTASRSFRDTVDELHSKFDYIVIASSAAGSADGDAALLASQSALLVISPGAVTQGLLWTTLERLERLGVAVGGAIFVRRTNQISRIARRGREPKESKQVREYAIR